MNRDIIRSEVLTGNQSIARGFFEASGIIAASYPGSPTVEVIETTHQYEEIYSEYSTNEKVALEVAIGGSFAGVRSMVVMKHVGLNIAADPLMTFTQTPTNGGFLLVSGDDPGLASSQNEQDNRVFAKFANMGIVDPSNGQEAKEFTKIALSISEEIQIPMMLRVTSRLCHSRSVVNLENRDEIPSKGIFQDKNKYCMLPPNSTKAQYFMKERLIRLEEKAYNLGINFLEHKDGSDTLIITSGMVYNHLKELNVNVSILKLGLIYPISSKLISEMAARYKNIVVLEEMTPFIENEIKLMGICCEGKKYFNFTGELDIDQIEAGLLAAGVIQKTQNKVIKPEITQRPPLFCSGCPHRPIFDMLKKTKIKTVVGDIGCYSMAFLHPFEQSNSIISMGASLGIVKGMQKALSRTQASEPLVAVVGDGTFYHSGIPGIINLLHKRESADNITIIILDNRTTAMTGGQSNASSGRYNEADDMRINIKELLISAGFDNVKVVDQFKYKEAQAILKEELAYNGLSIIIAEGPCALRYKIVKPNYYVKPDICIGCRTCIRTNCPPLKMKSYEGIDKLKSSIEPDQCVGCSVCAQVCPVNAIHSSKEEQ